MGRNTRIDFDTKFQTQKKAPTATTRHPRCTGVRLLPAHILMAHPNQNLHLPPHNFFSNVLPTRIAFDPGLSSWASARALFPLRRRTARSSIGISLVSSSKPPVSPCSLPQRAHAVFAPTLPAVPRYASYLHEPCTPAESPLSPLVGW